MDTKTIIVTLVTDRTQADVERVRGLAAKGFAAMTADEQAEWLVQRFRSEPRGNRPELSGGTPRLNLREERCMDGENRLGRHGHPSGLTG